MTFVVHKIEQIKIIKFNIRIMIPKIYMRNVIFMNLHIFYINLNKLKQFLYLELSR